MFEGSGQTAKVPRSLPDLIPVLLRVGVSLCFYGHARSASNDGGIVRLLRLMTSSVFIDCRRSFAVEKFVYVVGDMLIQVRQHAVGHEETGLGKGPAESHRG